MKKVPGLVLVSLMLAILALLLVFMCMPYDVEPGGVRDGVLDLRGRGQHGAVYTADGDWEFAYGQPLVSEEFSDGGHQGEYITVPASWESRGYPQNGTSTYRLTVLAEPDSVLQLYLPHISGAYAVWVDGEPWFQNGILADTAAENDYIFRSGMVPVPVRDGDAEVIVQVSNHCYYNSGITRTMFIGERTGLWSWFLRTRGLYIMVLGGILMAAFYHLSLYLFRQKDKAYLLFCILCAACAARFVYEDSGLLELLGIGGSVEALLRVYYILLLLHTTIAALFCCYMFRPLLYQRIRWAMWGYMAMVAGVFLLLPIHTSYGVFQMISVIMAIWPGLAAIAVGITSPALRRDRWLVLFLVALVQYVTVGTLYKLMLQDTWYMFGLFNNMFVIMAQSLVLSRSYTRAFTLVEETNENLEGLVAARTAEIQATNHAMKELIGNISHDLKTPLTVMSVNLEQLDKATERQGNEEFSRCARIAYKSNEDLQRLTQNLLEVSRIESGRIQYDPEWRPLTWLLFQVQERYGDHLESEDLALDVSSGTVGGEVWLDRGKVWSVFDNIIYNAARYTEPGGEIAVEAGAETDTITITVRDTGCGIKPEHLPRLFERFYKVSAGRGGSGESGVGLYIVKSIMEGLGGAVEAQSEPGKGTAIRLTFRYRCRQ